jgi:DNA-binding response OmpR family regulator
MQPISQPLLLVADPDEDLCAQVQTWLTPYFQVECAHTLQTTYEFCRQATPIILVLEAGRFPDGRGIDLISPLHETCRSLWICCYTMHNSVADKVRAFQSGANNYLIKTISRERFTLQMRVARHSMLTHRII